MISNKNDAVIPLYHAIVHVARGIDFNTPPIVFLVGDKSMQISTYMSEPDAWFCFCVYPITAFVCFILLLVFDFDEMWSTHMRHFSTRVRCGQFGNSMVTYADILRWIKICQNYECWDCKIISNVLGAKNTFKCFLFAKTFMFHAKPFN